MAHQVISATNLARNFSDFLNRVRYQGITIDVTRGNDVVACISPPRPAGGYPIEQLDKLFASLPSLTSDEAAQFDHDMQSVLSRLKPEVDAWAS